MGTMGNMAVRPADEQSRRTGKPVRRSVLRFRQRRTPPVAEGKVVFVLSGGGNRGVAQVGMLRALLEAGIQPDVVVGTSVGSLNGAAIANEPTLEGVDRLQEVWRSMTREQIFADSRLARAWRLASRANHLWGNLGLVALIESFGVEEFAQLRLPLRVIACDLISGEEVLFSSGPLAPALLASCALPGVFPPVEYGGRLLVDGGVLNNVPVSHALAGPTEHVYVCDTSADLETRPPQSAIEVILRSFTISRLARSHLDRELHAVSPKVTYLPRVADERGPFDFSRCDKLAEAGYRAAREFLAERSELPQAGALP